MIPRPTDGVCWYVSARMPAKWRKAAKGGLGEMIDPHDNPNCKQMFENNAGWPMDNVKLLATWSHMKTQENLSFDFKSISSALSAYGPFWVAGNKTWAGAPHFHVIVVLGVADTGVLIHDPEPVNVGTYEWRTWKSINNYLMCRDIDYKVLTCP